MTSLIIQLALLEFFAIIVTFQASLTFISILNVLNVLIRLIHNFLISRAPNHHLLTPVPPEALYSTSWWTLIIIVVFERGVGTLFLCFFLFFGVDRVLRMLQGAG